MMSYIILIEVKVGSNYDIIPLSQVYLSNLDICLETDPFQPDGTL